MPLKTTRNEPCPCGSGRKYKNCCQAKDAAKAAPGIRSKATGWIFWLLGAFGLLALVLIVGPFSANQPTGNAGGVPGAQAPGPAPAGKVWSAEHGHWHDVPGTQPLPTPPGQPAPPAESAPANTPQPAGPAPAGKVWSPEHGHWHDLPQ